MESRTERTTLPEVDGILETALYVADLDRAERFYKDLFGFETLFADSRLRAMNVRGKQVLLLFLTDGTLSSVSVPGGTIPPHNARGQIHFAFAISADSLPDWQRHLEECKVPVESVVHPPRGGTSLYFRDPDNHLVELATPGLWAIY